MDFPAIIEHAAIHIRPCIAIVELRSVFKGPPIPLTSAVSSVIRPVKREMAVIGMSPSVDMGRHLPRRLTSYGSVDDTISDDACELPIGDTNVLCALEK